MRVLLLGRNGQLGWELHRALAPLSEVIALDRSGIPSSAVSLHPDGQQERCGGALGSNELGRLNGDLSEPDLVVHTARILRPDVIVNAAAYTAVDRAESEPDLARVVNATAPGALAREAAAIGALLIHYSTDYVFDGSGTRPWREDDRTEPLGVYGKTKLDGERAIRESGCRHLILRTSWVYGAHGSNFLKTILRLANERDSLSVVADQVGAPTSASLIANVSKRLLSDVGASKGCRIALGTYHLAARGETNWCDYARYVVNGARARGASLQLRPDSLRPIATQDYPTPAMRPRNSRLDCSKLESALGMSLPPWEQGVDAVLDELLVRPT